MFFRVLAVSALVAVASAANCAVCPSTDLVNDPLIATSGGSNGTPTFCGYSPNGTGSNPTAECFYSSNGALSSGPTADCRATATVANVC